jgi:PEP-CTERM motif
MQLTITRLLLGYAGKRADHTQPHSRMGHVYKILTLLAGATLPLPASTITGTTGLCNTGFAPSCGALLSNQVSGTADGNYKFTLTGNPFSSGGVTTFVGLSTPAEPDPLPSPWIPDTPISQWIAPASDEHFGGGCCTSGNYDYQIPFTSVAPGAIITGRWAADNSATMYLDGGVTINLTSSFSVWTAFSFTVPAVGPHTLDFLVFNSSNASGLRIEFTDSSTPEPGTLGLLGGGLGTLGLLCRKKPIAALFTRIRS